MYYFSYIYFIIIFKIEVYHIVNGTNHKYIIFLSFSICTYKWNYYPDKYRIFPSFRRMDISSFFPVKILPLPPEVSTNLASITCSRTHEIGTKSNYSVVSGSLCLTYLWGSPILLHASGFFFFSSIPLHVYTIINFLFC